LISRKCDFVMVGVLQSGDYSYDFTVLYLAAGAVALGKKGKGRESGLSRGGKEGHYTLVWNVFMVN